MTDFRRQTYQFLQKAVSLFLRNHHPSHSGSSALPSSVLDAYSAPSAVGAQFRKGRPGAEHDLVDAFLERMPFDVSRGRRATVFREPRLESGFPDLVIVIWRESATRLWPQARLQLQPRDLRLIHLLYHVGRAREHEILAQMGKQAADGLARLHDAKMIRLVGESWVPMAMGKIYAAERIIAVEAKIKRWADVIEQAALNTWFASTSVALVPRLPNEWQLCEASMRGVGVCSVDAPQSQLGLRASSSPPRSYASWLFNEWAWRASLASRSANE